MQINQLNIRGFRILSDALSGCKHIDAICLYQ